MLIISAHNEADPEVRRVKVPRNLLRATRASRATRALPVAAALLPPCGGRRTGSPLQKPLQNSCVFSLKRCAEYSKHKSKCRGKLEFYRLAKCLEPFGPSENQGSPTRNRKDSGSHQFIVVSRGNAGNAAPSGWFRLPSESQASSFLGREPVSKSAVVGIVRQR